mgnify:CR=1 FL=1
MIPESASELPVFNFMKASSICISVVLDNSPDTDKLPVIVTSPVIAVAPEEPVIVILGVCVDPAFAEIITFPLLAVFAIVKWFEPSTDIVTSEPAPNVIPESLVIVNAPVVVLAASFLIKFPPAISDAELFVVPDVSTKDADVFVPSNTALKFEFNVNPALIVVNPDIVVCGVNVTDETMHTCTFPTYILDITLSTLPLSVTVSTFQPDNVCPEV